MDHFIKCHGLLKDEMIANHTSIKLGPRYYAFEEPQDTITLVQWSDEKTIVFIFKTDTICIQFWKKGKNIKNTVWNRAKEDDSVTLLSACLEFYSVHEAMNEKWITFLQ